jgi:hypothetical protein
MFYAEIAIFGSSFLAWGYAAFYLVLKVPVAVSLLLTRGLLWLLGACLLVGLQALVAWLAYRLVLLIRLQRIYNF